MEYSFSLIESKKDRQEVVLSVGKYGLCVGVILWFFLMVIGKPAPGGLPANFLVFIQFAVSYAVVGGTISLLLVFLKGLNWRS
jgi:sterol desaturase/sphingolipid hydroxylase (fatty acid hydroxylase superfamily)